MSKRFRTGAEPADEPISTATDQPAAAAADAAADQSPQAPVVARPAIVSPPSPALMRGIRVGHRHESPSADATRMARLHLSGLLGLGAVSDLHLFAAAAAEINKLRSAAASATAAGDAM